MKFPRAKFPCILWLVLTGILVILYFYPDTARALDFSFHERRYSIAEGSLFLPVIGVSALYSFYYSLVSFRTGNVLAVFHCLSFSALLYVVLNPFVGMSGLPNRFYVNTTLPDSSWSYWAICMASAYTIVSAKKEKAHFFISKVLNT